MDSAAAITPGTPMWVIGTAPPQRRPGARPTGVSANPDAMSDRSLCLTPFGCAVEPDV